MVEISRDPFGEIEGRLIDRFTLANRHGLRVEVITYGGIIRAWSGLLTEMASSRT